MTDISHRTVQANGIAIHVAEAGRGPAVLLCHGFPESWYAWRHQLGALADAGFRAIAPDMRGYGETDAPAEIERYTLLHLVGDMVGLLDALGEPSAAIAGHDWGAPVAWHAALLRPDRFRAVIGLSVPYQRRGTRRPTETMPVTQDAHFYQLHFQQPGVAEAEMERDARDYLRAILYTASGDAPARTSDSTPVGMVPKAGGFVSRLRRPETLPAWLSEHDLDVLAEPFRRTGFRGGLNWYRNIDRNWELLAPFADLRIAVPALYIAGDRDIVVGMPGMRETIARLADVATDLRGSVMLPGCGHWTQQERPAEVNQAMIAFLRNLH